MQAALSGMPMSADSLQKMLGASGSPLSTAGKALFLVGFLVFGTCTFWQNWSRTKAAELNAYAESVENLYWQIPEKEPDDPRYPPNPDSSNYNWAYWVKKDNGEYGVDVPASATKEYEKLSEEVKERAEAFKADERREYYETKFEFWMNNYEDWHETVNEARDARRNAASYRNSAIMGVKGYFFRWLGIGCMFLGMAFLALKGERNEQLIAVLVIGLGLVRLVT